MLELLNFFDAADTATNENAGGGIPQWVLWVVLGVVIIGFIVYTILAQRKQKKRAEEMMSKLVVGNIVTTIGGIVGEIIQIDDKHIWLTTGTDDNKTTMQFLRQAVHSVVAAPGVAEADVVKTEEEKADEIDEIK